MIDFIERHGTSGIRQIDLGARVHRNQDILALGRMAFQVLQVMTKRAEDLGRAKLGVEWPRSMAQFASADGGPRLISHELEVVELPPLATLR